MGPYPVRVLVLEDHDRLARWVELELSHAGYEVFVAPSWEAAKQVARQHPPSLLLLDLSLPDRDGYAICEAIRSYRVAEIPAATPIIMMTARDAVQDRVAGLRYGADDYLTKPFDVEELKARMEAVIRRFKGTVPLQIRDLAIDPERRRIQVLGQPRETTRREFDVLWMLARHVGQVLTRDQIEDQVWGLESIRDSNILDVYISRIRRQLDGSGVAIYTERGLGFRLDVS